MRNTKMKFLASVTTFLTLLTVSIFAWGDPGIPGQTAAGMFGANLLQTAVRGNPGFENGKKGWTITSGDTFNITSTAANVGSGQFAASWSPTATGKSLCSPLVTIPAGLYGKNGYARLNAKTAGTDYLLKVLDGSDAVLNSVALNSASYYTGQPITFIYPTTGGVKLCVASQSAAAIIYLDDAFIGDAVNLTQVSQAEFVGESYIADTANCTWVTTSTTMAAFPTDNDCPGPTIVTQKVGSWQTTDTNLPQQTVNNLPPGIYHVEACFTAASSANAAAAYAMSDGTTTGKAANYYNIAATQPSPCVSARFEYTTTGNHTFSVYGQTSAASNANIDANEAGQGHVSFKMFKYPLSSQIAVTPDLVSRFAYASWNSVANCAPITQSGTPAAMTDADCNSATVTKGAVVSLNDTFGATFLNILPGEYKIRFNGVGYVGNNTTNTFCKFDFHDGSAVVASTLFGSETTLPDRFQNFEGNISYSSLEASKTFTLRATRITGDGYCAMDCTGDNCSIELIPMTQSIPALIILNQVSTTASGGIGDNIAAIASAGSSWPSSLTACATGTCGTLFGSSLVASAAYTSTGLYTITLQSGVFPGTNYFCEPHSLQLGTNGGNCKALPPTSATSVQVECRSWGANALQNDGFTLSCKGLK